MKNTATSERGVDLGITAHSLRFMFTILGVDGKEYGPVTAGKLHEWIAGGRANMQTKARREGETDWKTLGDYPELSQFGKNSGTGLPTPPVVPPLPTPSVPFTSAITPSEEIKPAELSLRFLAALIDGFLKTLCYLPITLGFFHFIVAQAEARAQPSFAEMSQAMTVMFNAKFVQALPWLALLVLVQLFLLARRGQSVGKLALGLRIVRLADNTTAGFLHAFLLRGTLPFMIEQIPLAGFLFWIVDSCFIFRDDRRCLHDLLAGTKVVKAG